MGSSNSITNSDKYAKQIDENKDKKNIIELEKLLNILKIQYTSYIDNIVKEALKKEYAIAMNFQLKISRTYYGDDWEDFYEIVKITNYHTHIKDNSTKIQIYTYNNLIYDATHYNIKKNLELLPHCKCVLSNRQLELYNHLLKSNSNNIINNNNINNNNKMLNVVLIS